MTPVASSPVAASTAAPPSPVFLVVVPDRAAIDRLPTAAAQAQCADACLLIAVARPRLGFTTDAAIARYVAINAAEERDRLEQLVHRMLDGIGVEYDVVTMPYRGSRSPAKRERRIAAAMNRLARRRGATPLPAPAHDPVPGSASAGRRPHVVAVLPDSAEAVHIARAAGQLALAARRPLCLVVLLPAPGPTIDPEELARGHTRISKDTAAVAGRVRPTLDTLGVAARVCSAPYPHDLAARDLHRGMAAAVEKVARELPAEAVVISTACPALPHIRIPSGALHLIKSAVWEAHGVEGSTDPYGNITRPALTPSTDPERRVGGQQHETNHANDLRFAASVID